MFTRRRVTSAWVVGAALLATLVVLSAAAPPPKNWVKRTIDGMTLREKVGQMFMTQGYGQTVENDPDPAMVAANCAEYGVDNTEQLIEKYHLGGSHLLRLVQQREQPAANRGLVERGATGRDQLGL